ncbi:hypothetical protein [Haladaptatus sp. DYF46]|uniref:hypothetical protein n=1 Tax=Haladaptatus sp. DYF46 TaxID=2886041 RepID=UPI001E2C0668|nr:hypothetical protein [Haladaptatus sp. DYF46]
MSRSGGWRGWFPDPSGRRGVSLAQWVLLEGNRHAVTGALLTMTFVAILGIGTIWPFEMQRLLTKTAAVQTVLNTFLGGIILLVSIVVSINSFALSYDIISIGAQEDRLRGTLEFRSEIGHLTDTERSPMDMDPASFLSMMVEVINHRAHDLETVTEELDGRDAEEIREHIETILQTIEYIEKSVDQTGGGEFSALWLGLDLDLGPLMERSRVLHLAYTDVLSDSGEDRFERLIRAFELITTGRHFFKTLYYRREFSMLSRTLLIVSLPAILGTATTILAINANILPQIWILGLSPLLTFVAAAFTVALAPFIILTAFMLRVATVTLRATDTEPFVL